MDGVEVKATELILDMGVSIPVRPVRFLSRKREPWRITMRTPYAGNLIRIGRLYLKTGIVLDGVKEYGTEENMRFMSDHGKDVSRMVAYSIVRGWFWGWLLNRIVAWWLLWRVHPLFLQEAWYQMMTMLDVSPFKNIIRSAEKMNLMKPRLSQKEKNRS